MLELKPGTRAKDGNLLETVVARELPSPHALSQSLRLDLKKRKLLTHGCAQRGSTPYLLAP